MTWEVKSIVNINTQQGDLSSVPFTFNFGLWSFNLFILLINIDPYFP